MARMFILVGSGLLAVLATTRNTPGLFRLLKQYSIQATNLNFSICCAL